MKHARKPILLSLALSFSFLLTSCGAKGFDNSKLVIGLECGYPPFNWTEKASNDFTLPIYNHAGSFADGYDIQIAKRLSSEMGKEVQIVQTVWDSLIADLQTGTINCIIAGMTDTAEREKSISFTDEYYHSELVLIVKKDVADQYTAPLSSEEFRTLVNGKYLESQTQTVTDDILEIFAKNYGAVHNTPVLSFALAAQDVVTGSAFAMTAELPVANSIVSTNSQLGIIHIDQTILGDEESSLGVSIGIQQGNTELQEGINAVLKKITTDERTSIMQAAIGRSANLQ